VVFNFYIKENSRKKEGKEETGSVKRNGRELIFAAGKWRLEGNNL
jgi:hypothetical protein